MAKVTRTRIVAICSHPDRAMAQQLMRIGVTGVLLRHELHMGFTHTVNTIQSGRLVISPAIIHNIVQPKKNLTYIA